MARIRTIKPEFFQDEKLSPLPAQTRLVFLGLISMADDAGRLLDNLKVIDAFIFPNTDETARHALNELAALGRIERGFTESNQAVIQIANWLRHQRVDKPNPYVLPSIASHSRIIRESVAPLPTTNDLLPTTNDLLPTTNDQIAPDGAGRSAKPKKPAKAGSARPDTWLTPARDAWEAKFGPKSFAFGLAARALEPLRSADLDPAEIGRRLAKYLAALDDLKFASLPRFAQTHGQYAEGVVSAADADLVALAEEAKPEAYANAEAVRAWMARTMAETAPSLISPFGGRSGLDGPFPATDGASAGVSP